MAEQTSAQVDEIAPGIYRVSSTIPGFTFNQILVNGEEPLLFHTGPRRLFPATLAGVSRVVPPARLRWIGLSHFEADECGAMNEWLAVAPDAQPLCGRVAKMTSVDDVSDRPARALADGEALPLGEHEVMWLDAPHLPHGWECGYLFERRTRTLLCGDLFTQPGDQTPALTRGDVLGPSEALRASMDYFSHAPSAPAQLERMALLSPAVLACMHGSAFEGDGATVLRQLAIRLAKGR